MTPEETMNAIAKRVQAAIEQLAERIGLILERETVTVLRDNDKNVTNSLSKSISHDVTVLKDKVIARVFAGTSYASVVHEGRRPGSKMPPIAPIQRWVHMRGLAGRYSVKTGKRLGKKSSVDAEDRAVAFLIARSIARKGIPGLKFFEIALKQALPRIEREIKGFSV